MKKSLLFFLCILLYLNCFTININATSYGDTKKTIYLTFDDGPGGKTNEEILDILKTENVPGTFFIIGKQIKGQENILLRMKDEGHSIGLHSFTHERNNLYPDPNGFINEMIKCQESIKEVTGESPMILRFPFGCNNSTYKLTSNMVDSIHSKGFKIFDWTVDTKDGDDYNIDPSIIVKRALNEKDNIILLMHCTANNKSTLKALPSIIKYYKNKGYEFHRLTVDTPEVYRLNK